MVLNVCKPVGWTSNDVVQKIKHSHKYKKVGHAGTLDPLANGVLILLTDADTKRQREFMSLEKEYLVKAALGYTSDSYDLGTDVSAVDPEGARSITDAALAGALKENTGSINQQVPAYSAVHINGSRSYSLARQGAIAREALPYRKVEIKELEICSLRQDEEICYSLDHNPLAFKANVVEFRVVCTSGTYIRSLVHDLGKALGCGAVVVALTRKRVGNFKLEDSLDLKSLF